MIKNWLTAAIVIFAGLMLPSSAMAATLSLSPTGGSYNRGCTFQVAVVLDASNEQTDGTDAILIYDTTKLTLSAQAVQTNTSIYPDYSNSSDPSTGKISISGIASVSQAYSGKGNMATVSFQVKSDAAPGPMTIRFDFDSSNKDKTTDSNVVERGTVKELLTQVTDGNYTIGSGTGCTSSGTTTTTGTGGTSGTGAGTGASTSTASGSGTTSKGNAPIPFPVGAASSSAQFPTSTVIPNQTDMTKGGQILSPAGSSTPLVIMGAIAGILVVLGIIGIALL